MLKYHPGRTLGAFTMPSPLTVITNGKTWNVNGDFEATLKKIHPGMSEAYYNRQIEEARTMLKQELWVLMDGI